MASAGNNGTNNDTTASYPASYTLDNIISVAATDNNDGLGGDLAEELSAAGSRLPVVLVTADAFAATEVQARVPDLAGVVLKPLAFEDLSALVHQFVVAGN